MRDQLADEPGLMDAGEIVNRVIAAVILATLTGLAGAVLASQLEQPAASAEYSEPDRIGTRDAEGRGPTITGGTSTGVGSGQPGEGFVVTELATTPGAWPPGASQLRWLRITNPNDSDIVVTRLSATVGLPTVVAGARYACLPSDLVVEPLATPVPVPAGGFAEISLVARLSDQAPLACMDALFPLTYAGVASTTS